MRGLKSWAPRWRADEGGEEMTSDLLESIEDGIALLTLNRPDRLNAFSDEMLRALIEAFARLGAAAEVRAIVLTGAGRGFCAGGDIKGMANRKPRTFEQRIEDLRWKAQLPLAMRQCPKIVIGMINGVAVGAGLALALACDLRVAARSARFGTAFAGVAFSGDLGGSWLLTRLVGTAKARELYFTADLFDAAKAMDLGMLTQVVDDAELQDEAMALARRFAHGPTVAYGYMKRNLYAAETESLYAVLEMETIHQTRTALTEDHAEAVQAFVAKRKPEFKGR
jgi:2-(1,2-epoxy-1,2-dihydrophenyl)acetyl-CoA isomerase